MDSGIDKLTRLHPEIADRLETARQQADQVVDKRLLDLCMECIDAVLTQRVWQPPHSLDDRERAFTAFAEQFATSVSTMSDEQVAALRPYASADDIYNFASALYLRDMVRRLEMVAGRVL